MNRGRNNFDVIRYEYYRDVTVQFEAFKAGDLDMRQENIARNWATAYDIPAVRDGRIQRAEIPHELPTGMQCFAFNTRRDYFKDKRVREAIATMFDFAWANKNLFYGMYKRNISFFGNSELASSGLPTPAELKYLEPLRGKIPEEVFTKEFKLPETDGTGNVRDLARRALALLKEAGWEIKDGKMTETKTGKKLAFEMLLNDASFERVVLPYKQNLERIGIDMNVRTVDTAQFKRREDEFDYDMMVEGFGQSLSPGNEQRDFWGSKAADTQGQPQFARHQGCRDRLADRDPDRRARPREPDQRHARARPRAAVEPLRGAELAQQHRLRRLLEPVRPAGQERPLRTRRLRYLVDRRGQGPRPAAREEVGGRPIHDRLHPAPSDAGGADPVRHHGDQLLHHPGRSRRPGRADAVPDPGHGGRRHGALLGQFDGGETVRSRLGSSASGTYRGARGLPQGADRAHREDVRLRQADRRALRADDEELPRLRFRRELLPQQAGRRPHHREDAGVDLARPLDDAADLLRLDPARHRQGGARRLALRRVDLDHADRAERHPGLPVRAAARRAVRRRQLLQMVPAARPRVRRLEFARARSTRCSTISGTWRCRSAPW